MSWDRPLQFFSNLYYNHPSNWGFSLRIELGSNRRYTRSIPGTREYPDGIIEVNGQEYYIGTREDNKPYAYLSNYTPKLFRMLGLDDLNGTSTIDVKLFKTFQINTVKMKLFFEIENLLDEMIPRRINSFTGLGYGPGVILPYSMINSPNPNYDPSRFRRPRTIELGMQFFF